MDLAAPVPLLGLLLAGWLAGLLNAVAGGGSFVTLPALMLAGVPPVAANATGTTALLPGYAASVWVDRVRLGPALRRTGPVLLLVAAGGGALGALLLRLTPDGLFRDMIPWLLLAATLLFAFGPGLQRCLARRPGAPWSARRGGAGIALACGYGGYFNGGVGILLLAVLRWQGVEDLQLANALKNLLSLVLTALAVGVYLAGGLVVAGMGLVMALGAVAGGIAGVRLVRRLPAYVYRWLVSLIGAAITTIFFLDLSALAAT